MLRVHDPPPGPWHVRGPACLRVVGHRRAHADAGSEIACILCAMQDPLEVAPFSPLRKVAVLTN
jgi:hypothetical protein